MSDHPENCDNPNAHPSAVEDDPGEGSSISRATRIESLLNEGKCEYLDGFFESASQKLSNALSLSIEEYGDLSPECFEPCFYYAKTLVDWTRCLPNLMESEQLSEHLIVEQLQKHLSQQQQDCSHLGDKEIPNEITVQDVSQSKVNGLSETMPAEQEYPLETTQCISGHSEGQKNGSGEGNQQGDNLPDKDVNENKSQDRNPDGHETRDPESGLPIEDDQEIGSDDDYEDDEDEADEESDRMAIAWNTLQDALLICENFTDGCMEWAERKAETLFALAEWYLEDTDYPEAIEAIESSIKLYPDARDRRIAAAYYELAKAYELMGETKKVAESRQKASSILVERLAFLESEAAKTISFDVSSSDGCSSNFDRKKCSVLTEIEELKEIISDLKEDLIAHDITNAVEVETVKDSEKVGATDSANGKVSVDDEKGIVVELPRKRPAEGGESVESEGIRDEKRSKLQEEE